jgi:hypothetical protein
MRGLLALLLVVALGFLSLALASCGTFGFSSNPGSASNTAAGTVSLVHLSVVDGDVQVTFVTLQSSGSANQFTFCGDQVSRFPMNTSVTVNFNPGQNCNQVVVVITG